MNREVKAVLAAIAAMLLSSCGDTTRYPTPSSKLYILEFINQEFTSSKTLSLRNGQMDTSEHLFATYNRKGMIGGRYYDRNYANYNKWTDVAIEILQRELGFRSATIVKESIDSIELAVIYVEIQKMPHTNWEFESLTRITLQVNLSNGYQANYIGVSDTAYYRRFSQSLMRSIVAMLNDPKVVEFLSN